MDRLNAPQQLNINDELLPASHQKAKLIMQGDGNLVLYRTHFGYPLWATNTWGQPVNRTVMQIDGDLVAYDPQNVRHWDTVTGGHPGAWAILQDDANFVVYDVANHPLWASNTVQNWSCPTFRYTAGNGYHFNETSESWKDLCRNLPSFAALTWPDYATKVIRTEIDGEQVVIQLWKGWCQKFLGLSDFPGGVGAEVGIYHQIPGRAVPTSLPFLSGPVESFILSKLANLTANDIWWPFPELNAKIEYILTNPVNNQIFFSGGPENSYWLAKWMDDDGSYDRYKRDQGRRWSWLPWWFPGNSKAPVFSVQYLLDFKINGASFPRW